MRTVTASSCGIREMFSIVAGNLSTEPQFIRPVAAPGPQTRRRKRIPEPIDRGYRRWAPGGLPASRIPRPPVSPPPSVTFSWCLAGAPTKGKRCPRTFAVPACPCWSRPSRRPAAPAGQDPGPGVRDEYRHRLASACRSRRRDRPARFIVWSGLGRIAGRWITSNAARCGARSSMGPRRWFDVTSSPRLHRSPCSMTSVLCQYVSTSHCSVVT